MQIAELMLVSVNTVRTHIRNVYAALDVRSHKELADMVAAVSLEDAYAGERWRVPKAGASDLAPLARAVPRWRGAI